MISKLHKLLGFTGVSLMLSLSSCRSTDTDNKISAGLSVVKVNLIGTEFNDTVSGLAQASLNNKGEGSMNTQRHSVLIDPSTVIISELTPVSEGKETLASTSLKNKAVAIAGDPLGPGIAFRIIAYKQSNGAYADSKDFIVGQTASSLTLDEGTPYTFICYSYGISTLPALSTGEQNNLTSAVLSYDDTNRDFMYQNISYTPTIGNNVLNITLNHKVARITTVLKVYNSTNTGNIVNVSNAVLAPHYSNGSIALSNGNITNRTISSSGAVLDFQGNTFPSTNVTSAPVFVNADTGGNTTGSFSANITYSSGGTTRQVLSPGSFKITPGNNSKLTINLTKCGAYLGPGNTLWQNFMCHNLGADMTQDAFTPSALVQGAKYQWGAQTGETGRYVSQIDDQNNTGSITGWITTAKSNGSWLPGSKTANDPCPSGYRVPSRVQWQAVLDNNNVERVGPWSSNVSQKYGSAIYYVDKLTGVRTLMLPASGNRRDANGTTQFFGTNGFYWSSTEDSGSNSYHLGFDNSNNGNLNSYGRTNAFSIRCIAE